MVGDPELYRLTRINPLHVSRVDRAKKTQFCNYQKLKSLTHDFAAVEALRNFRESIDTHDAWRHENPETRAFTFTSNTHSMSRLDRIYVQRRLTNTLSSWELTDTTIPSDHKMVLVRLSPPNLPCIGPGRWTMPLTLLTDKNLIKQITLAGFELQHDFTLSNPNTKEVQLR